MYKKPVSQFPSRPPLSPGYMIIASQKVISCLVHAESVHQSPILSGADVIPVIYSFYLFDVVGLNE